MMNGANLEITGDLRSSPREGGERRIAQDDLVAFVDEVSFALPLES